jgi:hypothetical protein
MATKPNPVASSTAVEGRPGVVQDWTADGQPYGQPHARQSANLDSGFGAPVTKTTAKATPKATAKATPIPTKGTQAGHAITDSKNHTRTVK